MAKVLARHGLRGMLKDGKGDRVRDSLARQLRRMGATIRLGESRTAVVEVIQRPERNGKDQSGEN